MKRWLAALVAALMLAVAGASALLLLDKGSTAVATDPGASPRQAVAADVGDEERAEGRGHGPPPWAHGHQKKSHGPGASWQALTPAERSNLMKRLSAEHAKGMKAFSECARAGRSDCEKPLPPGLAKRR